ncbi:MAG: hypothetical protein JSV93_06190 [Candidatus Omnitrophota bacterium]|nr:MAG: hypothetical protein JSV93_06190 [Candidatus Omnitrophota bacterium]
MIKLILWLLIIGLGLWYTSSPHSFYNAMDNVGLGKPVEMFDEIIEEQLLGGEEFDGIFEIESFNEAKSALSSVSSMGKGIGYFSLTGLSLTVLFFSLRYILFYII